MYADWLTEAGFRVDQAHNGLQALERAFDSRPHVVVTDLNIPGIDGFELTRRLKQDVRTRDVPVLAVTGYAAFALDPERARRAANTPRRPTGVEALPSVIVLSLARDYGFLMVWPAAMAFL